MNLAGLSIKRPIFISCVVIGMLAVGFLSFKKLGVDLFPNIAFPIVMVNVPYPGAGPQEVETLVSKVLEEQLSTVTGIKALRSVSKDSLSTVVAEFTLETDVKFAEQQIKDRVAASKRKLPADISEPMIRRLDPADQPIMVLSIQADLPQADLFRVADEDIKPRIEQVNQVGLVELIGGRKREIHVELDQRKLKSYELSSQMVASRIAASGMNVPGGKVTQGTKDSVVRTLGEFRTLNDVKATIVNFLGNDIPVTVGDVGTVTDSLRDEDSRAFVNGKPSLFLMVFRQSGANTIKVTDAVKARVEKINTSLEKLPGKPRITIVTDNSKMIHVNVQDVQESIVIGIILTILVVYFFLGNVRSTLITGLALPNSLLGAFILMAIFGFTINVMTLLALSLTVGLLVDDAIVVRENIFRHLEMGKSSIAAALDGTKEVTLAVVATTLAVIAVFGPIGFLKGVVGQFFKEFGLTICFAMAISLFDALTIAPMLSAYFAGVAHSTPKKGVYYYTLGALLRGFDRFQTWLEDLYEVILKITLRIPILTLLSALGIFVGSVYSLKYVSKTFLSPQDFGEFAVGLDLPPGTTLENMSEVATAVDATLRKHPEVRYSVLTVGGRDGQTNVADFFVQLVPRAERTMNTSEFKGVLREELKAFSQANPKVKDVDMVGGGMRPFSLNIAGQDLTQVEDVAAKVLQRLKNHPALLDVDTSSRPGKPELQVQLNRERAEKLGVSTTQAGLELRTLIEGQTPAVLRESGSEYDIRVRLQPDQRDLEKQFPQTYLPNINYRLLRASDLATLAPTTGPANINRQDRGRYIQISAEVAPNGPGLAAAMADVRQFLDNEIKLPEGMSYNFVGQAESFEELIASVVTAVILSVIFIYLVLASLYESFVTPFTIMLVLPLALAGAFFALLITGKSLDLNSMIGCILLLGIASKNSILLVDYANQKLQEGMDRTAAILASGRARLRPILMTTFALIAGMLPIAIGLNEASKQRTTMGVAIIGGLISSMLLTLVVVPAAYSYIDRFRVWSGGLVKRAFVAK